MYLNYGMVYIDNIVRKDIQLLIVQDKEDRMKQFNSYLEMLQLNNNVYFIEILGFVNIWFQNIDEYVGIIFIFFVFES